MYHVSLETFTLTNQHHLFLVGQGHRETAANFQGLAQDHSDSEASLRLNHCPDVHKICAPLSVLGVHRKLLLIPS